MKSKLLIIIFGIAIHYTSAQDTNINNIETLKTFLDLSKLSSWEQAQDKDGVSIHYRDITFKDSIATRQILVKFITTTSIKKAQQFVTKASHIESWNDAIKSMTVLKQTDSYWIAHSIYNIPFPLTKKDLVAKYWIEQIGNNIIVHVKSIPNFIPEEQGLSREAYNLSQWILSPKNSGLVEVVFTGITLDNSKIPRFIKDPIVQRKLLNSFLKLKTILEGN